MSQPPMDLYIPPLYYTSQKLVEIRLGQSLTESESFSLRIHRVRELVAIAHHLGLPYYTRSTALYLMHRFYASPYYSEKSYEPSSIALASLSLAMKMNETVKKFKDVYIQQMACLSSDNPLNPVKTVDLPSSKEVTQIKDKAMPIELLMQEDMRFEEAVISPYRFVIRMARKLKGNLFYCNTEKNIMF